MLQPLFNKSIQIKIAYVAALLKHGVRIWKTYGIREVWQRAIFFIRKKNWQYRVMRNGKILLSFPPLPRFSHDPLKIPRVLFVSSGIDKNGFSERYRVRNLVEALRLCDVEAETIYETGITKNNLAKLTAFPVVVFFRISASPIIEHFIEILKKLNVIIIFSIDDLLFGPDIIPYLSISLHWTNEEKEIFGELFTGYRKILTASHYCIASSQLIAETAQIIGIKSFVVPSGLSIEQLAISEQVLNRLPRLSYAPKVVLGYFSGSDTHDKDFATIIASLSKILEKYPQVHLYLVGLLPLPEQLKKFGAQITTYPFIKDTKRLMKIMQTVDINLAPLETQNPFCRAKNDMKYFEAGILELPTIATDIEAFSKSIRSGHNGFLAKNDEEWYQYLETLIKDSRQRRRMGKLAREHVLKYYTPDFQSQVIKDTFKEILGDYCRNFPQTNKNISI